MQQMIMNLDDEQQRPVVILGDGLTALLDTGAYVPVWVGSEDILVKHLGAKFIKGNVPLSGFGGVTSGNMYQVTIQVGKLTFPNMHIIANSELVSPFNMILSATMFNNLIYEINDKNHKFTVMIPDGESMVRNLRIIDSNGRLSVLCSSASDSDEASKYDQGNTLDDVFENIVGVIPDTGKTLEEYREKRITERYGTVD